MVKKLILLAAPIAAIETMSLVFKWYYIGLLIFPVIFFWIYNCRVCRLYESIWLFLISAVALFPYNVILIAGVCREYLDSDPIFFRVCAAIGLFACLSSIEELIIGIIGRIVWRKQRRIKMI